MTETPSAPQKNPRFPWVRRILHWLLKIGAFFLVLEPIWMLLPFAGFLYGSVLHIETLSSNPRTAWLVHFVFPTLTLFPFSLILSLLGLCMFLVGATQIYSAKLFRKGAVSGGIYRWIRHPQYAGLILFGLGLILTWGRFISYLAFFLMVWLYVLLARAEEKRCLERFGESYADYCRKTKRFFPGERYFLLSGSKPLLPGKLRWIGMPLSFVLVMGFALGSGFLIQHTRSAYRRSLPAIQADLPLLPDESRSVPLLMVKGPVLQASPRPSMKKEQMGKYFETLTASRAIREAVGKMEVGPDFTLLAFLTPGSNWHDGHAHHDYREARIDVFILVVQSPVAFNGRNFSEFRKNWRIYKNIRAPEMNYGRMEAGLEPVEGQIAVNGPPWGRTIDFFNKRMEERVDFFLSGL